MMKTNLKFALAVIYCCVVNSAYATPPSDMPPQLEKLEETGDPAVSNSKPDHSSQTVQTTQNGQQTEVKVTNDIGTYIVKPNQNVGNSLPGDAQSSSNHPVQWVIKSWGGSKSTEPKADEAPPTLAPNPDALPQK